jgi:hypothetical protein
MSSKKHHHPSHSSQRSGSASQPQQVQGGGSATAKKERKAADVIVARGVAIQTALDESAEGSMSIDEKIEKLDMAVSLYQQALSISSNHRDASYNLAVALLERREYCSSETDRSSGSIIQCIELLEMVIASDTSGRGETAVSEA